MKILIVGGNKSWWAIERYYINHLKELGAEVHVYAAPDIIFEYHSRNLINKVLFKTKIKTGYKGASAGLIAKAESLQPDIIWIFKGMEIYPSALEKLRVNFKLVNYNPDHPFHFMRPGGGNENVSKSVGLYHLHFCYNSILQKEIEMKFHIPTVFLPFAYELSEEDYLDAEKESEIKKVCFIGNPDAIRENAICKVAASGYPIDVYGNGWHKTKLSNQPNVTVYNAVSGPAFWKKIRAYRVQLNIFRDHNLGSHNMRSFEIPAVGGIQLAPYSDEHASFFNADEEIFLYRNPDEIIHQLKKLMGLTEEEAFKIRAAARARSLNSKYSYRDRSVTVYNTFKDMLANG